MSEHGRRDDDKVITRVLRLWPLMVMLFTLVGTYFTVRHDLDDTTKLANKSAETVSNHAERIARLEFIAESIPEMRSDMKKILSMSSRIDRRGARDE